MVRGDRPRWAHFGPFRLKLSTGELYRNGHKLPLRPQCFLVLRALVEKPAELVSREQLIAAIWADGKVFVEHDLGLNAIVRRLRAVLDDDAKSPRYIETLPRRGYRFIAPVSLELGDAQAHGASSGRPPEKSS